MKTLLRILLTPVTLILRLILGLAAFAVSISESLLGLLLGMLVLLACVEFGIGYWQNGIALLVLTWLISPAGLPVVAYFLLDRASDLIALLEEKTR